MRFRVNVADTRCCLREIVNPVCFRPLHRSVCHVTLASWAVAYWVVGALVAMSCSTLLLSSASKTAPGGGGVEYCHFETFRARCPPGDVILMRSAFYGRRNLGRCVRTNFGFIGCYADVVRLLDRRCTGRISCDVDVIEPNFDDIRPCNVELKSYLQADYTCISVADGTPSPLKSPASTSSSSSSLSLTSSAVAAPPGASDTSDNEFATMGCHVTLNHYRPTALPRSRHDLADDDIDASSRLLAACGGDTSPWLIKVSPGQRINITLYEFGPSPLSMPPARRLSTNTADGSLESFAHVDPSLDASSSRAAMLPPSSSSAFHRGLFPPSVSSASSLPIPYGRIRERNSRQSPVEIYGGMPTSRFASATDAGEEDGGVGGREGGGHPVETHLQREWHVLTTETSAIEVVVNEVPGRDNYLLTFTVVGCPDLSTGPDVDVRYSTDRSLASVTCRGLTVSDGAVDGVAMTSSTSTVVSWRLACSDRGWHGYIGNCSAIAAAAAAPGSGGSGIGPPSASQAKSYSTSTSGGHYTHLKASTALVASIVIGVSVVISLCVLAIGLVIIKRLRCYRGTGSGTSHSDAAGRHPLDKTECQLQPLYQAPRTLLPSVITGHQSSTRFESQQLYRLHHHAQQPPYPYPDCPYSLLVQRRHSSSHRSGSPPPPLTTSTTSRTTSSSRIPPSSSSSLRRCCHRDDSSRCRYDIDSGGVEREPSVVLATTTGDVEATLRRWSEHNEFDSPQDIFDLIGNTDTGGEVTGIGRKCDSKPALAATVHRNVGKTADCSAKVDCTDVDHVGGNECGLVSGRVGGLGGDQLGVTVTAMSKVSADAALTQTRTIEVNSGSVVDCLTSDLELVGGNGCGDRMTSFSTTATVGTRNVILASLEDR